MSNPTDLDDFQAGFIAGWFRHAGITETPTIDQLSAAVEALQAFEAEAGTQVDDAASESTTPSIN